MTKFLDKLYGDFRRILVKRGGSTKITNRQELFQKGFDYGNEFNSSTDASESLNNGQTGPQSSGSLRLYFDSHQKGRGIWKWIHYFEIYERHLSKFVGQEVHVLEIGVYSGGSLEMWREYFGTKCHIYGIDLEESCKVYENDWTKIFVGDQADRKFWESVKKGLPNIDIVIDDGGHKTEEQIITFEELMPQIHPGGVYLCEDIHGNLNAFNFYISGLAAQLHTMDLIAGSAVQAPIVCRASGFQAAVHSIHIYPYMTVIEKNILPICELRAPKHGTEWQPFL